MILKKNRSETSKELSLRQQTNALIKKLEELKSSTSSKTQMITDKETFLKRISEEALSLETQTKDDFLEIEKIDKQLLEIRENPKNSRNRKEAICRHKRSCFSRRNEKK